MKSIGQMHKEAWGILKGKWFWRLLAAGLILQGFVYAANFAVVSALEAAGITSVGEFIEAKLRAATAGLSYALPTTKAYVWMSAGFLFQTFIAYVFSAIFAFGFMGLLLKARADDDRRWLSDSMSGFARPLDVTCLMILLNIVIVLAVIAWFVLVCGVAALCRYYANGMSAVPQFGFLSIFGIVCASMLLTLPVVYAYRQTWFIKNEDPSLAAVKCLRASRKMMKGFKMDAFLLDFSFVGWIILFAVLYAVSTAATFVSHGCGAAISVIGGVFGLAAFYILVKTLLGILVARAVFFRELQEMQRCA